jgi:hypothetical protein
MLRSLGLEQVTTLAPVLAVAVWVAAGAVNHAARAQEIVYDSLGPSDLSAFGGSPSATVGLNVVGAAFEYHGVSPTRIGSVSVVYCAIRPSNTEANFTVQPMSLLSAPGNGFVPGNQVTSSLHASTRHMPSSVSQESAITAEGSVARKVTYDLSAYNYTVNPGPNYFAFYLPGDAGSGASFFRAPAAYLVGYGGLWWGSAGGQGTWEAALGPNYKGPGARLVLVAPPAPPILHVANASPASVTLWWTSTTPGYALQYSETLTPTNWVNAITGTNTPVTVPAIGQHRFYRLMKP